MRDDRFRNSNPAFCRLHQQPKHLTAWANNNNNNNKLDNIYSAVIYGASHMREFTLVPLGGQRQVAANS